MIPRENGDYFDYSTTEGFSSSYVNQFYANRPVSNDEVAVIRFLIPHLMEFSASRGGPTATYLEIGCGPTLHHAIMVAPYVKHMTLSDFLEGNRDEVEQWRNRHPEAFDWKQYARFILETEQTNASDQEVAAREEGTRGKIIDVIPCDLMSSTVLATRAQYDLVGCFYCLEEVARTPEAFHSIIANVASVVRSGGTLMIAALRSTSFYHVQSDSGEEVAFPCLSVSELRLRQALADAGFETHAENVVAVDVEGQAEEGIPGVILAFVTKKR